MGGVQLFRACEPGSHHHHLVCEVCLLYNPRVLAVSATPENSEVSAEMKYSKAMRSDEVTLVWDLRAKGVPSEEIAVLVGWSLTSVRTHFREYGGVRPRVSARTSSLTIEERIEIQACQRANMGVRKIARELGRSPSTISRELRRNTDDWGKYRATRAQANAHERARRPKPSKLAAPGPLREWVQTELTLKRSPEQIAGRLRREFPDRPEMHVSPETIYQAIYLLPRGGLKREVTQCLRTGRTLRRSQRRPEERRGRIPNMVNIVERPAEAADRAVPGRWEGDLVIGKDGKSAIGTVVERHSNYLLLVWMDPTKTKIEALTEGLIQKMKDLPDVLRRTLTWDQGVEMLNHVTIGMDANIDIYFCDPRSPWQRPTNENTNGLLRQYFPKGTDLSVYSQADLDYVEWEMNDRPRKLLEFAKPSEVIADIVLP